MKFLAFITLIPITDAFCSSGCSGHGLCEEFRKCKCFDGWTGGDCSQRTCPAHIPWSDFPNATDLVHSRDQNDEEQRFTCDKTSGNLVFTFRGKSTSPVAYNADDSTLKNALESLTNIGQVQVVHTDPSGPSTICDAAGVEISITFLTEHGDVPSLVIYASSDSK